jgi:putative ABC transport system substrate-binding protein
MQFDQVRRRDFITLLGGAAAGWPIATQAQQQAMPAVGFLHSGSPGEYVSLLAAFRLGLKETGYVEGQNVGIEYRWAEEQYDRLPGLAADMARQRVTAIFAGGPLAAKAAKEATPTLPIVFSTGTDPIRDGLVTSFNRPGGNVTGVTLFYTELAAKRLELLHDLVPKAGVIALLVNPNSFAEAEDQIRDARAAARTIGLQLVVVNAGTASEIEKAFATLVQERVGALVIASDFYLTSRRDQLVALAARHTVPTIFIRRDFVAAGGLISYGVDIADMYRQAGVYIGRILKGDKPADLPVIQPTKFDLAINLKTARALGLTVPLIMRMTADEVIE